MAVYNPPMPYTGQIHGGFGPGRVADISGTASHSASRISFNFQLGPNVNPRDDVALHIQVRFDERCVVFNSIISQSWGMEVRENRLPLTAGDHFQLVVRSEQSQFTMSLNGSHIGIFPHRLPSQMISFIAIDGDCDLKTVSFSGGVDSSGYPPALGYSPSSAPYPTVPTSSPYPTSAPGVGSLPPYPPSSGGGGLPYPGGGGGSPYPPSPGFGEPYPPSSGGPYPPSSGGPYPPSSGGPYPPSSGGPYPPSSGGPYPPSSGTGYPPQGGGYLPQQPGGYPQQQGYPQQGPYPHSPKAQKSGLGGYLGAAGLGGLMGTALGAKGAGHHGGGGHKGGILGQASNLMSNVLGGGRSPQSPAYPAGGGGGMGGKMGAGLGAGAVGAAALYGGPKAAKKAFKLQRKQNKLMKYGVPLAAGGVGAYALHKGLKGHKWKGGGGSSSSSSSSSSSGSDSS